MSSMSSDSEDSFADPHPPGYKQPQPLSTHTHQMMTGWIQTEKPTAGPTPPPTTGRKKGLHQLHFSPQVGFKSSRRSGGGGGTGAGVGVGGNRGSVGAPDRRGDWQPGRSDYRATKDSPLLRLAPAPRKKLADQVDLYQDPSNDLDDPGMIPVRPLVATPVGTTRRPITPPDEDEMDAMFSLRAKEKGKSKATLSQMRRVDRDAGEEMEARRSEGGDGPGFPDTVADSQKEGEENDVFGLPKSGRLSIGTVDLRATTRDIHDEAQESIMFLGQRNATASSSKSRSEVSSRPTQRRTSQANAIQTKLSGFLKPLTPPEKPKPKSKRGSKGPGKTASPREEVPDEVEEPPLRVLKRGDTRPAGKRVIYQDRAGARAVIKHVDTQDIVPDSQTFDEEIWNDLPLEEEEDLTGVGGKLSPARLPRSDTGEDLDHAIEVGDESMVVPFALTRPSRADISPEPGPEKKTNTTKEVSSDISMRGSSDDELHSLAYRDEILSSSSKRQINKTSATAEDDESYRPVGFAFRGSRGRKIPFGEALLRPKSGLRAMMQASASPIARSGDEEALRSTRSIRSRSKAKPVEAGGMDDGKLPADSDTDSDSSLARNDVDVDLADAARAATEKARLKRTTSGGSSRTSITAKLFDGSSLTPLPSDDEEGPDVIQVMAPDLHRDSALLEMMDAGVGDIDEQHMVLADGEEAVDNLQPLGGDRSDSALKTSNSDKHPEMSDETIPGTFFMDDAAFESSSRIAAPAATLPPSFVHDMEPSLFGENAIPMSRWEEAVSEDIGSKVDLEMDDATPDMHVQPHDAEPASMKTPTPPVSSRDHSESPFVAIATPPAFDRPACRATETLRTPHRQPLRDLGFAVPMLGQPRTPIRPASTKKFLLVSPRSPITPSKATPARSTGSRPGSAIKSPLRQEEWVDNVETLATWSPAKFESYYTLPQIYGGGSSLRQAFEETLRKDTRVPSPVVPEMDAVPRQDAEQEHDTPPKVHPSSDSATHSDNANGKSSLRSEPSSSRKRKLPGSEDDTIPGTYQNSGPSLHLLQSIPPLVTPAPKRARKSDQREDERSKKPQPDPELTPKPLQTGKPHLRQTPVLDPGNPLADLQDDRTPRAFSSVADAWAGAVQDPEPPSPAVRKKAATNKYHDGKEQTSLQSFGYFKQQKKKEPTRKLLDYDRDFEDEHDVEADPVTDLCETDDSASLPAHASLLVSGRGLARVPLPPMDPRLRKQGRQVVQQMLEKESEKQTHHRVDAVASPTRPDIHPMQSAPRSDPHEARIYSMEDLEAPDVHDDEIVPSSQQGENLSPLRSIGSSGRRSTDDGSSYRTMEPPGEETQLWWKNMTDSARD